MKPTEEQGQSFWERCGLSQGGHFWYDPEGKQLSEEVPLIDLNNLFKYAVPKLQDKGHCVTIQSYEQAGYLAFVSESVFSQRGSDGYDPYFKRVSEHEDKDPAIALFWVIWKVMETKWQ